ncbi:hypothetical protein [Streptomyces sp. NPDC052107]|uniref:DODA-type extradiol aromatic ring-opening family dioxygenase n=1 Tax=Streptomyces sp. NPDC052107 TaxID=3155632 RepID=UPI0034295E79
MAGARRFAEVFAPDLVVDFGPDHYNGFFHDLMPPYCIGLGAQGVGDYGTSDEPLDVPMELAERMVENVVASGIDIAFSRRMMVDHGTVQPHAPPNDVADHKTVLTAALRQIPLPLWSKLLIRIDGAAFSHALLDHLQQLTTNRRRVR